MIYFDWMLFNVQLTVIQQMTKSLQKIIMYACKEVELDCHNETLMLKSVVTDSTTQCHLQEVTPVLCLIIIYKTYTICVIYDNEWFLHRQIMRVTNKLQSTTDPYYNITWPWYSLSQWAYTRWRLFQEHVVCTKLNRVASLVAWKNSILKKGNKVNTLTWFCI